MRERQQRILRYVWGQWKQGRVAHIRDMNKAAGYRDTAGAWRMSEPLIRDGWLVKASIDSATKTCCGWTVGPRFGGVDKAGRVYGVVN